MRRYLSKLDREAPRGLDKKIAIVEKEVWAETDCLSCANCCKTMTPTFNKQDQKRIAAYLNMTVEAFQKKYLILRCFAAFLNLLHLIKGSFISPLYWL